MDAAAALSSTAPLEILEPEAPERAYKGCRGVGHRVLGVHGLWRAAEHGEDRGESALARAERAFHDGLLGRRALALSWRRTRFRSPRASCAVGLLAGELAHHRVDLGLVA